VTRDATEDFTAKRARLLQGFWSRAGVSETLATEAVECLRQSWPTTVNAFVLDELLAEVLQNFAVYPAWIERALTTVRRQFLFKDYQGLTSRALSHLAIQCHLNEYAWFEDAEETARVEEWAGRLTSLTPDQVMALACYRPLARLDGIDDLLKRRWSGPVADVLREQVVLVREEQAIAAAMPTLGAIRDETSLIVQAQYEVSPYPRWSRPVGAPEISDVQGRALPDAFDLLIAGCGTGRHAIDACDAFPGARILAIDLSRASLAYAVRKTRELGLEDRVSYAQADLLEMPETGRSFFMVQSAGVLHHMADPFAGARALARMVEPGGFLALALYSARARVILEPAKVLGRGYTPETIRDFRRAILDQSASDPACAKIAESRDFYATSGCRDLLMHVNEHQHDIADIQRILVENDLEFLGFVQFPQLKPYYVAMFPDDPQGLDLDNWDRFETAYPMAFARMYQFWTAKRPAAGRG
jgi:2-polyprenyl-3-methyl-5-hydroxy-6-metoxy-1,4-benzoquinol methylase